MSAARLPPVSIDAFEAGEIDADAFDHEAHLYLGWLYLQRLPLIESIRRYSDALRHLTRRLGIPGKYHETITWFYLAIIDERRRESGGDWFEFRRRNDDLFGRSEASILRRYYRRETLASERARNSFVLPDRLEGRSALRKGPRSALPC